MIETRCGKCGRLIKVTEKEAQRLDGMLVCPQCLGTVEVDVPPRNSKYWCHNCGGEVEAGADFCRHCGEPITAKGRRKKAATPPPPPATRAKPKSVPSPPPYRPKAKPKQQPQATSQATSQARTMPTDKTRQRAPRKQSTPKESPKKPLSSKGCLLITIAIVVVFFAIYFLIGNLMN